MKKFILAILMSLSLASPVLAAKPPESSCTIDSGYLYATNLPLDYPVGLTYDPYPIGIGSGIPVAPDGSYSRQWSYTTAYFWVRGHGPSDFKPGKQLNDYHVIAMCAVP